jgi:hypothetical protein
MEGSTVKEGLQGKVKKVVVYVARRNGLHADNIDRQREANH